MKNSLFKPVSIASAVVISAMTLPAFAQSYPYFGPLQKVGHSLKDPETFKRIANWLKQQRLIVPARADTPDNMPPLVNGQYGFPLPASLEGVPKAVFSLGEADSYGIVIEKLPHRLSVVKQMQNGNIEIIKTFRAITGRDPGEKEDSGDLRTPEGVYFITQKLEDQHLPARYGRMAFVLDYPNPLDKSANKSGYGIWIHATDNPKRLLSPLGTEGCVAMSNEDIQSISRYLVKQKTPVIITKEMLTTTFEDHAQTKQNIIPMIETWRASWEKSDLDIYSKFYSDSFYSTGMNKSAWIKHKENLSKTRNQQIKVSISAPQILAFEDQLVLSFSQNYQSDEHTDIGKKTLYLKWEGNQYKIVAEQWSALAPAENINYVSL